MLATLVVRVHAEDDPQLAGVLRRAGAYVETFGNQLSRIVAEEHYVQTWKRPSVLPGVRGTVVNERELQSDLMLVKPSAAAAWLQYRDVFAVDSLPVRDRAERLTRLFAVPSASTDQQVARIQAESARLNLGDIDRTFNTPLFALQFLETAHQARFAFTHAHDRRAASPVADDSAAFRVSTEIWTVSFEEVRRPTIIHTSDDRDVPTRGRFWIDPQSGQVLMSEFTVRERQRQGTVTVSYQSEPLLGLLVPVEMRERYIDSKAKSEITAVATYGKFRQVAGSEFDALR
ncbi:MAG: hypothetical protein U0Q11_07990 [Vicinamibacterales bacterium]